MSAPYCSKAHNDRESLTAQSKMSRKGWKEQGNLPCSLENTGLHPDGGVLITVLDPWEPASSHSAQGNSPPPPVLEELLTGGERLVEQVLCRELSPKPWETWTDGALSVGLCPNPGTGVICFCVALLGRAAFARHR